MNKNFIGSRTLPNSKKGLSTVVTTLIIILLVFISVGIIWVVIRNVIEGGIESIDYGSKCLEVNVKASQITCDIGNCDVTLTREAGGEDIAGVKITIYNSAGTNNSVVEYVGNIAQLGTVTPATFITGLTDVDTTKTKVVPYFEDGQGNEVICSK